MWAVKSLQTSGERSGFYPEKLIKGVKGQPLPYNDIFWSVSHKGDYAAGIVSKSAAGIDIEKIKDVSVPLFKRIVSKDEQNCFKKDDEHVFFRCFTAKEAVLKAVGVGLTGLSDVSIIKVIGSENVLLMYKNDEYKVEHIFFNDYIASVVKNDCNVNWHID
jgi:4'-phosphopantetheinyl transferase